MTAFCDAVCLTTILDISRINDGDSVEATLQRHAAKFHNTCKLEYSSSGPSRGKTHTPSLVKKMLTSRNHVGNSILAKKVIVVCACFVKKPGSSSDPLHEAMTRVIGERG